MERLLTAIPAADVMGYGCLRDRAMIAGAARATGFTSDGAKIAI